MEKVLRTSAATLLYLALGLGLACHSGAAHLEGPYLGMSPPGDSPERFAPEVVTTPPGVHSAAVFSPDGDVFMWSPMARHCGETHIMRLVDGVWTEPEQADFGMGEGIGEPFYSPDGQRLYFTSCRATPEDEVERERIWFVERLGDEWSGPRPVDDSVASHPTHWQFSVAADYTLYFTSEITGVRGGQDIYMAEYKGGRYLKPKDLGPNVNSDGIDLTPYIAPDQSYLLFARRGAETREADLYVSFREAGDRWSPAVALGEHVNTDGNDLCPIVSPDGMYLFFTRRTERGYGIYWVDASFIQRLRPGSTR